ncbi:MAG: serine/threonine-protein kinase, partial [Pseudoxanthomonas sp.]
MDTSTTGTLRHWFEAVLDQPAPAREAWLQKHCQNEAMRRRVAALLAAHADTEDVLLDMPVLSVIDALRHEEDTTPMDAMIGSRIGAFRLLRRLGQGGMATVFLGEREGADFKQYVAVKLLRRGLYSTLEQRLFLRERRTLATLSHPDIARLIDGGVTDAGVPYLVMDYVDGVPITQYAAAKRLSLRARLDLFQRVCRAVDSAHRQLVVHRDIKPSNILVTAAGDARLLDFGVAKLLDENGEDA